MRKDLEEVLIQECIKCVQDCSEDCPKAKKHSKKAPKAAVKVEAPKAEVKK